VVIPSIYDTFCAVSKLEITAPQGSTRTTNMLLLRCRLIWAGGLLYVNSQFLFSLFLVHRSGWKVNFIAVNIKTGTWTPSVRPVTGAEFTEYHKSLSDVHAGKMGWTLYCGCTGHVPAAQRQTERERGNLPGRDIATVTGPGLPSVHPCFGGTAAFVNSAALAGQSTFTLDFNIQRRLWGPLTLLSVTRS